MKKKRGNSKKNTKELKKTEKEFISFGNRKEVFWSITFATIFISIIGIPAIIQYEGFLKRFMIIWILEIIYIGMWIKWGERKKK
ncbi:MAG: hypothetical protein AABY32_06460 [Nanoarchaeota archaeon]